MDIVKYFQKSHNYFFLYFMIVTIIVIIISCFLQLNSITSLLTLSISYIGLVTIFHSIGLKKGLTFVGFDWYNQFRKESVERIQYQAYISALEKKLLLPTISEDDIREALEEIQIKMDRKLKEAQSK